MTAADLVQRQLDAYNAQDIDAFMACFAEDCLIADLNSAVSHAGSAAIRARYAELFARYPENRARLINRIAVGNVVIDHEDIRRSTTERISAIAIYTIKNGLITRCDFVRET